MVRVSAGISCLNHSPCFSLSLFFFSQKASNITRILLQDLRNEQPDKVNILVATHELESFAIKHARLISQRKKNLTVQQNLFGESVFVIFSWIYKFASSFILTVGHIYTRSLLTLNSIYSTVISLLYAWA